MALIEFASRNVAPLILHAQSSDHFMHKWDGPVDTPELILVVDQGVSLMSNGLDDQNFCAINAYRTSREMAYAEGLSPYKDADWYAMRQRIFGDYTGVCHLDVLEQLQTLIDLGHNRLYLSIQNHAVTVFDTTSHGFACGDVVHVPSGLGGVFQVEILELSSTNAKVQNVGNCEDFDDMTPYLVPLDVIKPIPYPRAA